MKLNPKAIIDRGYVLNNEYKAMLGSGKLEKLRLVGDTAAISEGIWVYPLEQPDKGMPFHFVFFNDPLMSLGSPRPVAGLVGIAKTNSQNSELRSVANYSDCMVLFKKAGQAAIDYFHQPDPKTKKKVKKKEVSK